MEKSWPGSLARGVNCHKMSTAEAGTIDCCLCASFVVFFFFPPLAEVQGTLKT